MRSSTGVLTCPCCGGRLYLNMLYDMQSKGHTHCFQALLEHAVFGVDLSTVTLLLFSVPFLSVFSASFFFFPLTSALREQVFGLLMPVVADGRADCPAAARGGRNCRAHRAAVSLLCHTQLHHTPVSVLGCSQGPDRLQCPYVKKKKWVRLFLGCILGSWF
jgi:hypothetical protein